MTKTFTVKQLLCITDGRVGTNINDVYDILNHIHNTSLTTVGLNVAYDILVAKNPEWFQKAVKQINAIKSIVGNDFNKLVIASEALPDIEVPQLEKETWQS